jgi:hypothetical protein
MFVRRSKCVYASAVYHQLTLHQCVRQSVIDSASGATVVTPDDGDELSTGIIAGLAVVGALVGIVLALFIWGCLTQRKARRGGGKLGNRSGGVGIEWSRVDYNVHGVNGKSLFSRRKHDSSDDHAILDGVSGRVEPGTMMAVLGPSGK